MPSIACLWRPVLAGVSAFGLTFVASTLAVMAVGPPTTLLGLVLLPACLKELSIYLLLGLAGGAAQWPVIGAAFGLCHALLHLFRPESALTVSLLSAAAAVLLPVALGGIAAAVTRRTGRRLVGFGVVLSLHTLVALAITTATLALERHQGIPLRAAAAYVSLAFSLALALLASRYSAASRVAPSLAESPKASASSR